MKMLRSISCSGFQRNLEIIAVRIAVFSTYLSLLLVTIILFTNRWIETITSNTSEIVLQVWSIVDTQVYYERLTDPDNAQFKCLTSNQIKIAIGAAFTALGAFASFFILVLEGKFNKIFRAVASLMSIFACVIFTSCLVCFDKNLFDTESFLMIRPWLYWLIVPIILLQLLSSVLFISFEEKKDYIQSEITQSTPDNSKKLRLQISSDPFHYLNSNTTTISSSLSCDNSSVPAQLYVNTKNEREKSISLQIDKKRAKSLLSKKLYTLKNAKHEILKSIKCESSAS